MGKKYKGNPVRGKSYKFALSIVKLVKQIQTTKKEYILSKQILKSGTSIGANIEEANAGQSKRDFIAKMAIASKEARETMYWLRLLNDSDYIETETAKPFLLDCEELMRLLTAIVKSSQLSAKH